MPISEPDLASRAAIVTGLSCPAAASTSALSRRSSLSVEPAGLAQAEFARPSRGRAPNRDFSFPCYISPVSTLYFETDASDRASSTSTLPHSLPSRRCRGRASALHSPRRGRRSLRFRRAPRMRSTSATTSATRQQPPLGLWVALLVVVVLPAGDRGWSRAKPPSFRGPSPACRRSACSIFGPGSVLVAPTCRRRPSYSPPRRAAVVPEGHTIPENHWRKKGEMH
jgi:hypothetical protein